MGKDFSKVLRMSIEITLLFGKGEQLVAEIFVLLTPKLYLPR